MSTQRLFLPENLRPPRHNPTPKRQRRTTARWIAAVLAVAGIVWFASLWRIDRVEVAGFEALPEGFNEFEGQWVPTLRLADVRRKVERWPGVAFAEVSLQLPGKLHIKATADEVCGSFPVRAGWRAIACDGDPGYKLSDPVPPLLVGFSKDQVELRRGLTISRRFGDGCGATVERVRRISPVDYELQLSRPGGSSLRHIVLVHPDGGPAETWFFESWLNKTAPLWSDLRLDDRIVVGGAV